MDISLPIDMTEDLQIRIKQIKKNVIRRIFFNFSKEIIKKIPCGIGQIMKSGLFAGRFSDNNLLFGKASFVPYFSKLDFPGTSGSGSAMMR